MKIVVWSMTPFSGRKSTNLLLLALQSVMKEGGEQVVIHADGSGSGPEHFLLSGSHRSRMMKQKEFGVEFLCKWLHCQKVTKEMIKNASYTFAEGRLHILPSGKEGFYKRNEAEAIKEVCAMMQIADTMFQNVWVELPAGESAYSQQILASADYVIVNLSQSPCEITKLESLSKLPHTFFVIGAYEQCNIYTLHNLEKLFPELKGRCGVIPYHRGLFSACCAGYAEQFFLRGIIPGERKCSSFFRKVENAYEIWKEGREVLCEEKEKERETAGI